MARFGSVITAMVTPFAEGGRFDLDAAQSVARWLVDQGNQGLVVAGTTGESPTLSHEEEYDLFAAVSEAVDVPVIAGTGSNSTAEAVEATKKAASVGVDGILQVTPYYNKPSQEGIYAHFSAIAESTDLPIMLYDIPGRTSRKIETETLLRLADIPNIVALKDAAGDPAETSDFIRQAPDDFEVYSGDDILTLPFLSVGAVGVVSVAAHWCAQEMVAMIDAFNAGDVELARTLNQRMIPSYRFETSLEAPNPVPSKAMLRTLGQPVGECRLPMGPTPAGLEDQARQVMAELEAHR